jgi:hypothetical protein
VHQGTFGCVATEQGPALVSAPGQSAIGRVRVDGAGTSTEVSVGSSVAQVVLRDGGVVVAPARRGEPLRFLAPRSLETLAELDLGTDVVIDAALDEDQSTLALLLVDAEEVTFQDGAHAVRLVELTGDDPVVGAPIGVAEGPGVANRLGWIDDRLVLDRELPNGRHLDVLDPDGTVLASSPAAWGFRMADIGAATVRLTETGLDAVGVDAASTSVIENGWSYGTLAPMLDGPTVPPSSPPEHLLRPVVHRDAEEGDGGGTGGGLPWALVAGGVVVVVAGGGALVVRRARPASASRP